MSPLPRNCRVVAEPDDRGARQHLAAHRDRTSFDQPVVFVATLEARRDALPERPLNKPIGDRRLGRFMMHVLWPAFVMSAVAEGVFFSIPPIVGLHLADSREAAYTVGFSSLGAVFDLQRTDLPAGRLAGQPPATADTRRPGSRGQGADRTLTGCVHRR
jgi:hypothetical protein